MPCFGLSAMYTPYSETGDHRGITVIEEQRQVVLGSTALFTKVGQLRIHMIGKRGGNLRICIDRIKVD